MRVAHPGNFKKEKEKAMSDKNKQSKLTELPKEVRWQFEEAVHKARPLCDARARLEDAIFQVISSTAHPNIHEQQLDPSLFHPLACAYCDDAIEAGRDRWEWALQRGECSLNGVDKLVKEIIDLLTNWK